MAHITLTDGRELDVDDSDTSLLDYYRGEGATVELDAEQVTFPYTVENGEVVTPPETDVPVVESMETLTGRKGKADDVPPGPLDLH